VVSLQQRGKIHKKGTFLPILATHKFTTCIPVSGDHQSKFIDVESCVMMTYLVRKTEDAQAIREGKKKQQICLKKKRKLLFRKKIPCFW
jgi:hypothetical protein